MDRRPRRPAQKRPRAALRVRGPCAGALYCFLLSSALQEDADVIGLSILSGAHLHICPRVMEVLAEKGWEDVLVLGGGIIADLDVPKLNAIGIRGVFLPGTPMQQIVDFIHQHVRPRTEQV
jgi:methylmalonyl-CoA mutase, C-terminal domain